jgi:cell wall-associated NlpC family hydrolase
VTTADADALVRAARTLVLLGLAIAGAACAGPAGRTTEVGRPADARGSGRETVDAEAAARRARGQRAVEIAMKHRGAPYQWGGAGPSSFDCSGFVRYVYAQVGVSLPHNAALQYERGIAVTRDSLEPGDLVFFDGLRHNGIYVGQGRFIHARQTGRQVNVAELGDDWYRTRWVGARRPW